jgi:hypothetical protein
MIECIYFCEQHGLNNMGSTNNITAKYYLKKLENAVPEQYAMLPSVRYQRLVHTCNIRCLRTDNNVAYV